MEVPDIIAFLLIASCVALKFLGVNSTVDTILIGIAAFYFGNRIKRGEN